MQIAVFVLSDPAGGDEALGRVFNALATAAEASARGDEAAIVFAGAGTRWPAALSKLGHPVHGLYQQVRPLVRGASCGCAAVFGATEELDACEVPRLTDHALGGTPGLASVRGYVADGWRTLVF